MSRYQTPNKECGCVTGRQKGFSLIETLFSMGIFMVVMLAVGAMVSRYGDVTKTEHARMNIQQSNRFIGSVFVEELRDSGAVFTLAHTGAFLAKEPSFVGIYPLNNNDFPDGIIIATGDPEAVTQLSGDIAPGTTVLDVVSAVVPGSQTDSEETPPWQGGDIGIILDDENYYVFKVIDADTSQNKIVIRNWAQPVYACGQLESGHYRDESPHEGVHMPYKKGSMVARLTNFAIYLFDEAQDFQVGHDIRPMIRFSDTYGIKNILDASDEDVDKSVITEDIWDFQLSYIGYEDFKTADRDTVDPAHTYFAGMINHISTSNDPDALKEDLKDRLIRQINIDVLTLSPRLPGQGEYQMKTQPILGDHSLLLNLPDGKFFAKASRYSAELRNFSVIL